MISNEILTKYNMVPLEEYKQIFSDATETDTELMFYNTFLKQTDYIALKLLEGSLTSAECTEELKAREYARMELSKLSGDEYTPKASKNIEERTTEAEIISTAILGTETNKEQASEQLRRALQMFAQTVDDDTEALSIKSVYPRWDEVIGTKVKQGFKFTYENELYKTVQPELTLSETYPPGEGMESLYEKIDETHAGTPDDPIPYNGNMELFNGKYYIQNGVIYECIRDSGTPLYHNLADLVGTYVKLI